MKLKCDYCGNMWNETRNQRKALKVYCLECENIHHSHSKPIKPQVLDMLIEPGDDTLRTPPSKPLKPYEPKTYEIMGIGVNGKIGLKSIKKEKRKL